MEFQNVGKHCDEQYCKQKDFLPFKCKFCEMTFCIDHRSPNQHNCKNEEKFSKKAFVCPICKSTVHFKGTHTEDEMLDIHLALECNQNQNAQQKQVEEKLICQSGKCSNVLNNLNIFVCKSCQRQLCLKHRFPDEHICEKLAQQPKNNIQVQQIESKFSEVPENQQNQSNIAYQNGFQIQNSCGYMQINQQPQLQQQHFQQYQQNFPQSAQQQKKEPRPVCDQCMKSFDDYDQLILHAQQIHFKLEENQPIQNQEKCSVCGLMFDNIDKLIQHAEKEHYQDLMI